MSELCYLLQQEKLVTMVTYRCNFAHDSTAYLMTKVGEGSNVAAIIEKDASSAYAYIGAVE